MSTSEILTPSLVNGVVNAVSISVGSSASCAVTAAGQTYCWGFFGLLGDGSAYSSAVPHAVLGISNALTVAVGDDHACALLNDGRVKCWGEDSAGQLGNGSPAQYSLTPVLVSGIATAISVDAGYATSCAVLADGRTICWGRNATGQLGIGTNVPAVSPVAMLHSGAAARVTLGGSGGSGHTLVTLGSGANLGAGWNAYGQLGDGSVIDRWTPVTASRLVGIRDISAGNYHACGISDLNQVKCWGGGSSGQLGDGLLVSSLSPVVVTGVSAVTSVSAGSSRSCAVSADGNAYCWGEGELGNGVTSTPTTAVKVSVH